MSKVTRTPTFIEFQIDGDCDYITKVYSLFLVNSFLQSLQEYEFQVHSNFTRRSYIIVVSIAYSSETYKIKQHNIDIGIYMCSYVQFYFNNSLHIHACLYVRKYIHIHMLVHICMSVRLHWEQESSWSACADVAHFRNRLAWDMDHVNILVNPVIQWPFNPFPHTTILQQTTSNIFCQKIENLYNWMINLWLKVENIVTKVEIARFELQRRQKA